MSTIMRLEMDYWNVDDMNDMQRKLYHMDRVVADEQDAEIIVEQSADYMGIEGATVSRQVAVRNENYTRWEPVRSWGQRKPANRLVQW